MFVYSLLLEIGPKERRNAERKKINRMIRRCAPPKKIKGRQIKKK